MVCKKCGHQNPETNKFCAECGAPLQENRATGRPTADQGSYTGKPAVNQGSYAVPDAGETWICPNDETENTGDVCIICGLPRPVGGSAVSENADSQGQQKNDRRSGSSKKRLLIWGAAVLGVLLVLLAAWKLFPGHADPAVPDVNVSVQQSVDVIPSEPADELKTATAGKLTMATSADFPPYVFCEGNAVTGIEVEIAEALARKLDLELQIDNMAFNDVIDAVEDGRADISLAGLTVSPERQDAVNFTDSYVTAIQSVIVTGGSDITSADNLFAEGVNYTIGVLEETVAELYVVSDLENAGMATVNRYANSLDAVRALLAGDIDCIVADYLAAKQIVASDVDLKILDTHYAHEEYAIAVSRQNVKLLDAINTALEELTAEGTVDAIVRKYTVE